MIVEEDRGLADNGEIWFAEADTPVGPWVYARKVVTHHKYTFYNPAHHPFFDQDGGRLIYFEGTYSDFLSGSPEKTPRYDYNQIMYRLALDDPRLVLPVPVYRVKGVDGTVHYLLREGVESEDGWNRIEEVAFFAVPNRPREGLIPVFVRMEKGGVILQNEPPSGGSDPTQPLFYALPARPVAANAGPTGTWRCKAKSRDGSELTFILEVKLEGEEVKGTAAQALITKGAFKEGKLELNLKDDQATYTLTGSLRRGKLTGEWKQHDTGESGTWEGEHTDSTRQDASPSVVPLYEYRRTVSGARFYSTNPDLNSRALRRSAQPICRVWRNPMSLLILDRKVKAVPIIHIAERGAAHP
jgi:hypothetical protein